MFGIDLYKSYENLSISWLGGTNAVLLVTIFYRVIVGIAWYRMFETTGRTKGYWAFVPFVGEYQAFRMVWDDFSLAFIFSCTTFIGWVAALGIDYSIIKAFAIVNFIMWWFMALLTSNCFQTSLLLGFLYAGVPWLGSLLIAFWPSANYKGPWSSDPNADQNVSAKERKKRRKKAAKQGQGN